MYKKLILTGILIFFITSSIASILLASRTGPRNNPSPPIQKYINQKGTITDVYASDAVENIQSETVRYIETVPDTMGALIVTSQQSTPPIPPQIDLKGFTTDNLSEGITNKYYQDGYVQNYVQSMLIAGENISISNKNNKIVIAGTYHERVPTQQNQSVIYTAGPGLELSGSEFRTSIDHQSLVLQDSAITVSADWIAAQVTPLLPEPVTSEFILQQLVLDSTLTVAENKLAINSAALPITALPGTVPVSKGGTGATTAEDARSELGLSAGGEGDIWVKRSGDTVTGSLLFNGPVTISNTLSASAPVVFHNKLTMNGLNSMIDLSSVGSTGTQTLLKLSDRTVEGYSSGFNRHHGNEFFNMASGGPDSTIFGGGIAGEQIRRLRILANGKIIWGPGNAGMDTYLRRRINTNGGLMIGSENNNRNQVLLSIKSSPSQSANLQEWWDSSENALAYITRNGGAVFNERSFSDASVRIEGDQDQYLFYSDAATDRIGIGTSTPAGKLQITVSSTNALFIQNNGSSDSIRDDSGARLTATGIWTDTSDRTKKTNILPLEYGIDELLQLNPVSYSWLSNGSRDIGFIAQEVRAVIPELVYGTEGDYSLSYGHISALLTRSIQQQQRSVDRLSKTESSTREQLDSMETEIIRLQKRINALSTPPEETRTATLAASIASFSAEISSLRAELITATISAALNDSAQTLTSSNTAALEKLIVSDYTNLHNAGLTGTMTAGILIMEGLNDTGEATLNTLSGALHLQSQRVAPIRMAGDSIEISTDGTLSIKEGILKGNDMIRGINVKIQTDRKEIEIRFPKPHPTPEYAVSVTPSWMTHVAVRSKSTEGFTVEFSDTPPSDAVIDWIVMD
jgi:hypothetical protein